VKFGDLGTAATAQGYLANLAFTQGDKCDFGGHKEGAEEDEE
jgi:hypothetical protein